MSNKMIEIKIFVAGPTDVGEERGIVEEVAHAINNATGRVHNFFLRVIGAQTTAPGIGDPQDLINVTADEADLVVVIFWRRFGSSTSQYSSGTEEEFSRAIERWRRRRRPQIMLYFRTVDMTCLREPDDQLSKVFVFREQIEKERIVYYKCYSGPDDFRKMLHIDLILWSATVIQTSEDLMSRMEPFLMPKSSKDRAEEALTSAEHKLKELERKFGRAGQRKALRFFQTYSFNFDGQFTVVDSNRYIKFHKEQGAIGLPYSQFFSKFDPILSTFVLQKKTGVIKLINWLSSDEIALCRSRLSGVKVERCEDWIRLDWIPFSHFEPWDWYILVEAHNEVHELDVGKIEDITEYLQRNGWRIIPGHYRLRERQIQGYRRTRRGVLKKKLFSQLGKRDYEEMDIYDGN